MTPEYKIHPAIGIARVGNSDPNQFYLAPEKEGNLPIECDQWGNVIPDPNSPDDVKHISSFKDSQGKVLRQGARFRIYIYDDKNPEGRELKIGDTIQGIGSSGALIDIKWTVWLANKKAAWYQFLQLEGEHGYAPDHPLRNPDITDPNERQKLIIDPGPQTITGKNQKAEFARGKNPGYAQSFPPPYLVPFSIDTLGEIRTNDKQELIVLGGYGHSGSFKNSKTTDFGQPVIHNYANNPGWFDDTSDGPVTAFLAYRDDKDKQVRYLEIEDPSWVVVGYPGYAPQIPDMVNMDEVVFDVAVRQFGSEPYLYGTEYANPPTTVPPTDLSAWRSAKKGYNPDYYPYFYKEIWPIIQRPYLISFVASVSGQSNEPHNTGPDGNFDLSMISVPPADQPDKQKAKLETAMREKIWLSLRQPGQENVFAPTGNPDAFQNNKPLMPLLCGDNPITNTLPSKFLRLTDTMLFLLKQWKEGKFINEKLNDIGMNTAQLEGGNNPGKQLDRGVLSNGLGGAFNPGAEVAWIIRNPYIFKKPYRINASVDRLPNMSSSSVSTTPGINAYNISNPLGLQNAISAGLEPGDLTKYSALPWQADFNECSYQPVNVTYEDWNNIYPDPDNELENELQHTETILWWPTHRPLMVNTPDPIKPGGYIQANWSRGIPQTNAGDYKMVEHWFDLGFVIDKNDVYQQIERNDDALGPAVEPGIKYIPPKKKKDP